MFRRIEGESPADLLQRFVEHLDAAAARGEAVVRVESPGLMRELAAYISVAGLTKRLMDIEPPDMWAPEEGETTG